MDTDLFYTDSIKASSLLAYNDIYANFTSVKKLRISNLMITCKITANRREFATGIFNADHMVQNERRTNTISVGRRSSRRWHCRLLPSAGRHQTIQSAAAVPHGTSHQVSYAVPLQDPCNNISDVRD